MPSAGPDGSPIDVRGIQSGTYEAGKPERRARYRIYDVATAADPARMARAFAGAVEAGRMGYEAGLMPMRDMAVPSTPVAGTPFFDLGQRR